jgi:hypothetical protein
MKSGMFETQLTPMREVDKVAEYGHKQSNATQSVCDSQCNLVRDHRSLKAHLERVCSQFS